MSLQNMEPLWQRMYKEANGQEFAKLWKSIEKLLNPPVNANRIGFDLSPNQ